ncbi:MAG: D-aminoacylase [Bacillota bacterium]
MFDLVIKNAVIVDGTGRERYQGSVGITGGIIALVVKGDEELVGHRVIDAAGQVVCPGFIDIHSHSDISILANPRAESSLRQGITTEIAGNCGWSMAPVHRASADKLGTRLVGGLGGEDAGEHVVWRWNTLGEWLEVVEQKGIGVNLGTFVGQSMVRAYVLGDEDRIPCQKEMDKMKDLVEQAMIDGAFGLSTGRSYMPGKMASTTEVVELCKVVARYDGLYTTHIFNQDDQVLEATEEVVEIGRRSGCRVQVAHQKVCTKRNWGKAAACLEIMEKGQARAVDILSDVYPFLYTQISSLGNMLPKELREKPLEEVKAILTSPEGLAGIRAEFHKQRVVYGISEAEWEKRMGDTGIVFCRYTKDYEGLDLMEAAARKGKPFFEAVMELLAENDLMVKTAGIMCEEDLIGILKHPYSMVSTDAYALDREQSEKAAIHPRHYGTYPIILERYVRELKVLTLEQAIRKMTLMPAERVGLIDRGQIRAGARADLVIFDPETIANRSTVEKPAAFPAGISYVVVNGQVTVEGDTYHDLRAGQVLRHSY